MTGYDDILNLLILYDTARGFLPLTESRDVLHHGILSFSGASGARRVTFFARETDGSFRQVTSRGEPGARSDSFQVAPETETLLLSDPGALAVEVLSRGESDLRDVARRLEIHLVVPVVGAGVLHGLIGLSERLLGEPYTETQLSLVHEIASLLATALGRQKGRPMFEPGTRLRGDQSLEALRGAHPPLSKIAGKSPGIRALLDEIVTLADYDLPVLITGETGTGKELVARALHEIGLRSSGPFEAVNCAAIPRDLVSSHLFGHEKGSFTGAVSDSRGAFERAGDGTLFLDEIGDMPLDVQASLLRVLQERRFTRVGGERSLPANARILSATNRNLEEAVAAGDFRADLFYRIQMYSVRLSPLRERREDIPILVDHILNEVRRVRGKAPRASGRFIEALTSLPLPGNVRELEGHVLSAFVRARGGETLEPEHLTAGTSRPDGPVFVDGPETATGATVSPASPGSRTVVVESGEKRTEAAPVLPYEEMEREYIRSVLRLTEGNKKQAAAMMRIPRSTLNDRMKKLGLETGS